MNTVISFTLMQLIGTFLSICAGIVAILTALNLINSYLDKWRAKKKQPEMDQNERIDKIEKLLVEYDKKFKEYDHFLSNDNKRISNLEESSKIDRKGLLALIKHAIDGNDIISLKEARKDLEEYLINNA